MGCARGKHPLTRKNSADEFVRIRDGRFDLRGKPHFYVGTNMWFGCYLSEATLAGGRQRLGRELDRLQSLGVKNIRLLAGSESSPLAGAISRGITRAPHDYDESILNGLDFCLAEMAKRDMRGILYLSNFWQWSGGFAQFVRWATGQTIPDPDKPVVGAGDWHDFMQFSAKFYQTPEAVALYRDYITRLIQRRNTVNGRIYRDDPAIMTWELANEPRPCADQSTMAKDVPIFCDWVDSTARLIHEQDANHLVCTGSEGVWGSLQKSEVFVASHKTSAIDYLTVHVWARNWGWIKAPELSSPEFESAAEKARNHIDMHIKNRDRRLEKTSLVLEEFGLPRDGEKYSPDSPTLARDEYYRRMFKQVIESCEAGHALQARPIFGPGVAKAGPARKKTQPQNFSAILSTKHRAGIPSSIPTPALRASSPKRIKNWLA